MITNLELKMALLAKHILFYVQGEINLFQIYQIRPLRIFKVMDEYVDEVVKKIKVGLNEDKLLKTFFVYEKVIRLLKDNPTFIIVETIDFSHGYEVTITIEDTTNPEKFSIAPFWDTHEMTYLVATGIFKRVDVWSSEDKTLSTRKYSLS